MRPVIMMTYALQILCFALLYQMFSHTSSQSVKLMMDIILRLDILFTSLDNISRS
jgi:hypothetical protein